LAETGITFADGTTLTGSWISYTSSTVSAQTITISPTNGDHLGVHTLLATFTSLHGNKPTYTAFSFTVTCTVTSFTLPSNPSNVAYTLFAPSETVDLTGLVYQQVPDCKYALSHDLLYTGLSADIVKSSNQFILDIFS
jgi:hypothetical protein